MFKFFKDSWDYIDKYSEALLILSAICHLFLLVSIALSFTLWVLPVEMFRADIFMGIFASIPYVVYYKYINKNKIK